MSGLLSRLAARAQGQVPGPRPALAPRILLELPHTERSERSVRPAVDTDVDASKEPTPATRGRLAAVAVAPSAEQASATRPRVESTDEPSTKPRNVLLAQPPADRAQSSTAPERRRPAESPDDALPAAPRMVRTRAEPVAAAAAARPASVESREHLTPAEQQASPRDEHPSPPTTSPRLVEPTPMRPVQLETVPTVSARPLPGPPPVPVHVAAVEAAVEAATITPTVHISIGRLDIRSGPVPTVTPAPADHPDRGGLAAAPPPPSLASYLRGPGGTS